MLNKLSSSSLNSIGKLILESHDFDLLVCKVAHLINRRPISFKVTLRESLDASMLEPITPEHLLYGRELLSVNIVPGLQEQNCSEPYDSVDHIRVEASKLRKALDKLNNLYHHEFLAQLMIQSIDKKDRYKPHSQKVISPGDIVLLIEPQTKRSNYPLGLIRDTVKNDLDEVTAAHIFKGRTRECVYRHVTSLIPILAFSENYDPNNLEELDAHSSPNKPRIPRFSRRAAKVSSGEKWRSNVVEIWFEIPIQFCIYVLFKLIKCWVDWFCCLFESIYFFLLGSWF